MKPLVIVIGLGIVAGAVAIASSSSTASTSPPIAPHPPEPQPTGGGSYPMVAGASYEVEVHPIATLRAVLDIIDTNANAARAATEAITIALVQDGWEPDSGHLLQSGTGDAARYIVQGVWSGAESLNARSQSGILTYDQPRRVA